MLNDFNFPKNFPFFDVNLFGHDFSKSAVLYLLFYSSKDINNRCPTCQNSTIMAFVTKSQLINHEVEKCIMLLIYMTILTRDYLK